MLLLHEEQDYQLLAPEVVDPLSTFLYFWYKEEVEISDDIPDLHQLIFDDHPYTQYLFDSFVESLCWRRYRLGLIPPPFGEDFSEEVYEAASEELFNCSDYYIPQIFQDVTSILNQKQLVYSCVEDMFIDNFEDIDNSPLQEVW